jgi:anti-sigma factor RsiW
MMLTCADIVKLVTDYLEGQLTPDERRRFEEHVAICPPCRALSLRLERLSSSLGTSAKRTCHQKWRSICSPRSVTGDETSDRIQVPCRGSLRDLERRHLARARELARGERKARALLFGHSCAAPLRAARLD